LVNQFVDAWTINGAGNLESHLRIDVDGMISAADGIATVGARGCRVRNSRRSIAWPGAVEDARRGTVGAPRVLAARDRPRDQGHGRTT
jgi:hypothetical protein